MAKQSSQQLEIKQETITVKQAIAEVFDEIEKAKKEKRKVNVSTKDKEVSKMLYLKYRKDAITYRLGIGFALVVLAFFHITIFTKLPIEHTIIMVATTFLFSFILQDELGEVGYVEDHIDQTGKKREDIQTITYYLFGYVSVIRPVAMTITPLAIIAINYAIQTLTPAFATFANAITTLILIVLTFSFHLFFYKKVEE